jgi:hypothetical protein
MSNLYVNIDGFLMCGPEDRSTSIVNALRVVWIDAEAMEFEILSLNDLKNICPGEIGSRNIEY